MRPGPVIILNSKEMAIAKELYTKYKTCSTYNQYALVNDFFKRTGKHISKATMEKRIREGAM